MASSGDKVRSSIVGFSRIGPNRELKKCVEEFWKEEQKNVAKFEADIEQLQLQRWEQLKATGLDLIPSNDYSLYDQMLDCAFLFGAIPARYCELEAKPAVRTYFAMARGLQEDGVDVTALPMKKWFDTNYHYIVPELSANQKFSVGLNKPLNNYILAKTRLGIATKPVLQGPITFLHLSHVVGVEHHRDHLKLLPSLLPHYAQVIRSLVDAGARYIQIDEPVFALNFSKDDAPIYHQAFQQAAKALQQATGGDAQLIFTTYFNGIVASGNLQIVKDLPDGAAIHLDLVRAPEQLAPVLEVLPAKATISLGLVDGRNVWLTPLQSAIAVAQEVIAKLGQSRVLIGTSCSLLHVPYSLKSEPKVHKNPISSKVQPWLSFGIEKIEHVVLITNAINNPGCATTKAAIDENSALLKDHSVSPIIHNAGVKQRVEKLHQQGVKSMYRQSPHSKRSIEQQKQLQLPPFPTTTIGSFPQSAEVRSQRARYRAGRISQEEYDAFINAETERCVRIQEDIGLDVLVHGEFERNDMVEFFAEKLQGFHVTANGWVQSYGSRCVKPGILYGDVQRNGPMTVDMIKYAQSLTKKPMKGMLTGPTTILKWSFVRNDQSYKTTVFQMALAIRDEVEDLDKAGIMAIQVDEPGFREGLPLDASQHEEYLKTTVEAFKISTGSVADSTQIYTHMCYSNFEDIFTHIAELDADVICIECSRSELDLLHCFNKFGYPLNVGPGLYDIHSPRVPSKAELKERLLEMTKYIPASRLFANPDCGLKTRAWPEVNAALKNLVDAVVEVRKQLEK